jgi:hypothetical protein
MRIAQRFNACPPQAGWVTESFSISVPKGRLKRRAIMPYEEFEITIKKSGEIIADLRGLRKQRVQHYREILEEIFGPSTEVSAPEEMPPAGVKMATEKEEKKEQPRLRRQGIRRS